MIADVWRPQEWHCPPYNSWQLRPHLFDKVLAKEPGEWKANDFDHDFLPVLFYFRLSYICLVFGVNGVGISRGGETQNPEATNLLPLLERQRWVLRSRWSNWQRKAHAFSGWDLPISASEGNLKAALKDCSTFLEALEAGSIQELMVHIGIYIYKYIGLYIDLFSRTWSTWSCHHIQQRQFVYLHAGEKGSLIQPQAQKVAAAQSEDSKVWLAARYRVAAGAFQPNQVESIKIKIQRVADPSTHFLSGFEASASISSSSSEPELI